MTVKELLIMVNSPLRVDVDFRDNFYVSIAAAEVKEGAILACATGRGSTIDEAIQQYCSNISNKTLVLHATSPNRRIYNLPTITPQ